MRKQLIPSVVVSAALALTAQRASAVIIGSWNFNDSNLVVDQGAGTLTLDPTLVTSSGAGSSFVAGTTVNALGGVVDGNALQLKSNSNNNKFMQFSIDTTGMQNLSMSLAAMRNPQGFNNDTVSYSTDGGTTFSSLSIGGTNPFDPSTSFAARTFDFSTIAGLNNLSNALFRIAVNGATNNGGTFIADNVQFDGAVIPPPANELPPVIPPAIGLSLAAADPVVITGGSTNLTAQVSNTAAAGAQNLNYTIAGSGIAAGLAPAVGVAGAGASNDHTVLFTGAGAGLQVGSAQVSDPNAVNNSQSVDVAVTVLDHATPALTTLIADFGAFLVGAPDASQSIGLDNLAGPLGSSLTAGLNLTLIEEIGDDGNLATGLFSTNLGTFLNKPAGSPTSFFDVFFDLDQIGSHSAIYRLHFADQDLPGAISLGTLDLQVQGVLNPVIRQDPPQPIVLVDTIPEPATASLAALTAAALSARRRRRA